MRAPTRARPPPGPSAPAPHVTPRLEQVFSAFEARAQVAALQAQDRLRPLAAWIGWLHPLVALLTLPALLWLWWRAHAAGDARRLGLLLCLLVGVAGNALASGALSGVHARYQARVVWLLPLAVLVLARSPAVPRPVTAV